MKRLKKGLGVFFITIGVFFTVICLLSLSTAPFYMYHWLGASNSDYHYEPQSILLLGGTAMPSESALIRIYYVREKAKKWKSATIYIAQLTEENQKLSVTDARKMGEELIANGIDSSRLHYLLSARSTREEALNFLLQFPELKNSRCVLVTSPENMRRAILTFKEAGFQTVGGIPTFSWSGTADFRYKDNLLGGRDLPFDAGNNLQLRYQFWNHLRYQLLCYREYIALLWYKLRGWA